MRFALAAIGVVWGLWAMGSVVAQDVGSAHSKGEALFENRCARCHSLGGTGEDGLAPPLKGVVGSPIAARKDYLYTDALKAKKANWTPENIDQYLANPQAFAPGVDMEVNSPDPAEREAIIDYLKTLK